MRRRPVLLKSETGQVDVLCRSQVSAMSSSGADPQTITETASIDSFCCFDVLLVFLEQLPAFPEERLDIKNLLANENTFGKRGHEFLLPPRLHSFILEVDVNDFVAARFQLPLAEHSYTLAIDSPLVCHFSHRSLPISLNSAANLLNVLRVVVVVVRRPL